MLHCNAPPSDVEDHVPRRRSFISIVWDTAGGARARVGLRPVRVLTMIHGRCFLTTYLCA